MQPDHFADSEPSRVFWAEIAPSDHFVQFYAHDAEFLDSLERFVADGVVGGDAVVVIATPPHLDALRSRIAGRGIDLIAAENEDRYIALTAKETLSEFIVDGWPDEELFRAMIERILKRARAGARRVRAFGEMVALLWAQGHSGATVRLEHLWGELCRERLFSLFCAYPKAGFTRDATDSIREICAAHSRVVHAGP